MMRFRYAISYESDIQPVETVRGEFEANGGAQGVRQRARVACTHWPARRSFRSVVIVGERLGVETAKAPDATATGVSEAADGVELEEETASRPDEPRSGT